MERAVGSPSPRHARRQRWASGALAACPAPPSSPATPLPPLALEPTSPRKDEGAASARRQRAAHAAALQPHLEQDDAAAHVNSWPLPSRAPHKRPVDEHPALPPSRSAVASAESFSANASSSSPLSPRRRTAKPPLLQELQAFVAAGLSELAHEQQASARSCLQRLQVFRQVFQRVIAAFSVYAPVLAQVQDEYERAVAQLRAQSLQVPALHAQLQTLQSHCVQEIAAHGVEAARRAQALKKQLKAAQARLAALAAQNAALRDENAALQAQTEALGRRGAELQLSHHSLVSGIKRHDDTLRLVHERARAESLALAQMASKYARACEEIAELKRTVAALEEQVGGVHVAADKATITLLARELQEAHAQLQSAARERLERDLARQSVLGAALVRVLDAQGVRVTALELLAAADRSLAAAAAGDVPSSSSSPESPPTTAAAEALAALVLEKLEKLEKLERLAPPPPASAAGATFLTEPEELRAVAAAGRLLSATDVLVGRGCAPDVPEFLQLDGVVRNLRYPRAQLERILARVWQHKDELEKLKRGHVGGGAQHVPLAKVFALVLGRMSASRAEAVESAYNTLAALERFASHSSDCRLFLEILRGGVAEDARQDQRREVDAVHDALAALEKDRSASGGGGDPALVGRVPLADVVQLLRAVFPWKSERALSALLRSLLLDQRGCAHVDYAALLLQPQPQPQDDRRRRASGTGRSNFAECLRAQYIDDLVAYRCHLQTHVERELLGSSAAVASEPGDIGSSDPPSATHGAMVSIRDLRDLLQACDVAKPVQEINRLLATASGLSLDQVLTQDALVVNAQQFVRKLPTLLVKPSGKFTRPGSGRETTK